MLPYGQYPVSASFQHVSGEYFLVFVRWLSAEGRTPPDDFILATDQLSKAEFRLGEDGRVKEMGVMLDAEMGDAKIWFQKETEVAKRDGYEERGGFAAAGDASTGGQRAIFPRPMAWQGLAPLFA